MGIIVREDEPQVNRATDKPYHFNFNCIICNGVQEIETYDTSMKTVDFPVCDQCLIDLKEIIMHKRGIGKAYTEALDALKDEIEKLKSCTD